ncbi:MULTISPECIES: hypothetical protein [Sorangium]|uniref:Secreted protein n=1 Tax=Sorangium cellulosum TaxID=56 RepID=A0A4P2QL05_SORCE|nr:MULTISPECIES: hypothetical protein [Sorangium]AUX30468.1 hypothetical protein SOCE836_025720 [Sorangium cellulosum]WCQ89863.1 hypothetical protein NQZ70_02556 [Sorangium sp. Soce836]
MTFSADFVKLRSLGLWSFLLVAAPLASSGCIIVDEDGHHRDHQHDDGDGWEDDHDNQPPPPADEPRLVAIDTDAALSSEPGEGVGIFVEYAAGGTWRLWTTCDTNRSKVVCSFDLYASVDTSSELFDIVGTDLEKTDATRLADDGIAYLHAETGSDIDAMTFTTTEGAIVRLEAYLDGAQEPRYVYWFGDGVLHEGAPTNPIDFQPTSP